MLGRGCFVLCIAALLGLCWFTITPPGTPVDLVGDGADLMPAMRVCKDSTHMFVSNAQDIGQQRVQITLKDKTHIADCATQFGKIVHLQVRRRKG